MTVSYPDDINLLAGFQKAEPQAERMVFQKYYQPLCLFAEHITSNLQAAEDIVSESFEKTWDRRAEFETLENLKAFLYRIVRNASINYSVAEKRHAAHHEQIRYLTVADQEDDSAIETEILRAELLQEIYKEIENLPDKCGQVFKLLFIHGLSTDKVADQLSINVQTVRTQKARAIQLIRTNLLKKNRIATFLLFTCLLRK